MQLTRARAQTREAGAEKPEPVAPSFRIRTQFVSPGESALSASVNFPWPSSVTPGIRFR